MITKTPCMDYTSILIKYYRKYQKETGVWKSTRMFIKNYRRYGEESGALSLGRTLTLTP